MPWSSVKTVVVTVDPAVLADTVMPSIGAPCAVIEPLNPASSGGADGVVRCAAADRTHASATITEPAANTRRYSIVSSKNSAAILHDGGPFAQDQLLVRCLTGEILEE